MLPILYDPIIANTRTTHVIAGGLAYDGSGQHKTLFRIGRYIAKSRPTYPDDAIQYILDTYQLRSGSELADVGCGTGISSQLFAQHGLHVTGVEPNHDMRQKAAELTDLVAPGTLRLVDGTAENTTLKDSSVDAVLCAQAFHWFAADLALKEFHRILKPEGWTVLIWNERDESDHFTRAYGDAFRKLTEIDKVEAKHGASGMPLLTSEYFCKRRAYAI